MHSPRCHSLYSYWLVELVYLVQLGPPPLIPLAVARLQWFFALNGQAMITPQPSLMHQIFSDVSLKLPRNTDRSNLPLQHTTTTNMPKGWLPGFLRHKSNKKQQQLLNETVIDYDEIYERSENREDPGGVFQRFLSEDAIQDLVTEANVLSTLRSHPAIGKSKEAQHLAAYVVKNARKTFLTLITSDTLHHVGLFKDANFTDNNLPVTKNYSEGPGGKFVITLIPATEHQGDGSEGPLPRIRDVFSQWNKKECDDFHQRQWVFLAPTFRPDIFEYKLDPNVPLPYIPTYRFSDPASGNFGLIQKVGLLNDHHNHEQLHVIHSLFRSKLYKYND